jgi:very-short-patch-repair endonuclease
MWRRLTRVELNEYWCSQALGMSNPSLIPSSIATSTTVTGAATPLSRVIRKLADARNRLVDRNLRNRLISTPLESSRTKSLRVWASTSDQVFQVLQSQKKQMTFLPVPDGSEESEDSETQGSLQVIDFTQAGETDLQTKLTKTSLEKKLKTLFYASKEYEEEQGVNILYIALGFLKWYEDTNSDLPKYAPLVLLPVELSREGAKDRYKLKARDEDIFTNVSLKLWLHEQHSVTLPEIPEEAEWSPQSYFAEVNSAIAMSPRWAVLPNDVLLGFFSFSKFLLWKDLDPTTWPEGQGPLEHPIIQKLLNSTGERVEAEGSLIPDDDFIDDHFTPHDLAYIMDADSSQTEAIQTAMAGKDLVIQGPPGTGKSQTITNIISSAIRDGKKVLFIAEKMAALDVVHQRLVKSKLGPVCLELHSRKANKVSVLGQIKEALDTPNQPAYSKEPLDVLKTLQDTLNGHAKRVNRPLAPWGLTPYEVLGGISLLYSEGNSLPDFEIPNADKYTKAKLKEFKAQLEELNGRLLRSGIPAKNPWNKSIGNTLTPIGVERLENVCKEGNSVCAMLKTTLDELANDLDHETSNWFNLNPTTVSKELNILLSVVKVAPTIPSSVLYQFELIEYSSALADLATKLLICQTSLQELDDKLIANWESYDLTSLRVRFAGSGGSIFSFFSSVYRQSVSELKGLNKGLLPKQFQDRLKLIDQAIATVGAKKSITETNGKLQVLLSTLWTDETSDADKLNELSTWLGKCQSFNNGQFTLLKKIASSERFKKIIERLDEQIAQLEKAGQQLESIFGIVANEHFGTALHEQCSQWASWIENVGKANDWPAARDLLTELKPVLGQEFHNKIWRGDIGTDKLISIAQISIYEKLWNVFCQKLPELTALDAYRLDSTLAQFRFLDKQRLTLASNEILSAYVSKRPTGSSGEMRVIRQEMNKKRNHLSVRKLLKEAGMAIQKMKPVFLMSPLSVAQFIPPGSLMFDLVIIDEASQVKPEDALGAIARAKQIITVGDDKQLPPTNFFNRLTDDEADVEQDEDDYSFGDVESILSLCNIALSNQAMLKWHYRSQHPGLIAVSNRNFYDNQLLLPPSTLRASYGDGLGVSMIKSPTNGYERGGANGGRNIFEAEQIAKEVIRFAKENPKKSLGVAAFSVKQRDAIRDIVDEQRRKHPELEDFFSSSQPEHFFIKNLESIQGDERDVIFISVGYGRDQTGRLTQTFGPLAAEGGERRLNVLISRAKERCTIFSSITADDVKQAPGKLGINAFREFLQYAEKGYFDVAQITERDFDSEFEESVARFIKAAGYEVQPQVGMSGFFIDIGVIDPNQSNRFLCGIECDGATYHSSRSARDRDRLRQSILEARGWKIYRIWSTDWFHRRKEQEQKLLDSLAQMQSSVDVTPSVVDELVYQVPSAITTLPIEQVDVVIDAYIEFDGKVSTTIAPHEWSIHQLTQLVEQIVQLESPVHEEEVARRVTNAFGLERAGSRIQAATITALRNSRQLTNQGGVWIAPNKQVTVRDRSQVKSKNLTQASMLPQIEIIEALKTQVTQSVRIHTEELIQATSRSFGFLRCGPDLREVIQRALDCQINQKLARDADGFIRLI